MKSRSLVVFIAIMLAAGTAADAQIRNIIKKPQDKGDQSQAQRPAKEDNRKDPLAAAGTKRGQYGDSDFVYMGRNDMDDKSITDMRACVTAGSDQAPPPVSKVFRVWSNEMSETASLRSFNNEECQVIGFRILDDPAHKWRDIDSLNETAQGHSIYKTEGGRLVLIRKVEASQFYIVVVPDHNKSDLKLVDLRMCGYPDTIKLFRRKVNSVSNCHDQKQKLYVFEKYKSYPGPMQTSSVIFDAPEFEALRKQGKFRGLVMYKLVGDRLDPIR